MEIDLDRGLIYNRSRGLQANVQPYPFLMQEILAMGGMVAFVTKRLAERN